MQPSARLLIIRTFVASQFVLGIALGCAGVRAAAPSGALVDYFETAGAVFANMDKDGVVLVDYGGHLGLQYNPVYIGQAALAFYYALQRSGEEEFRQRFLRQVQWLIAHAKPVGKRDDARAYEFNFEWGELKPGWRSGLAQAQSISALIRAYYITREETLLPIIRALVQFMYVPFEKGGVQTRTPEGYVWIEEFPFKTSTHVLNGHIFAVFALYEYTQLFPKDHAAQRFYQQCMQAVAESLKHYDSGMWHNVDRHYRDPATENYIRTHTEQLRWLYRITGNSLFSRVRLRWLAFSMERSPHNRTNTVRTPDGRHYAPPAPTSPTRRNLTSEDVMLFSSTPTMKGFGVEALLDSNPSTYFAPENFDISPRNPHFFALRFVRAQRLTGLRVALYNPELYPRDAQIEIREQSGEGKWKSIAYIKSSEGRELVFRFAATDAAEIRFSSTSTAGQDRLILDALVIETGEPRAELPEIGNYLSDVFYLGKQRLRLHVKTHGLHPDEVAIQSRCAEAPTNIFSSSWPFDFIAPGDLVPADAKKPYCQYRITHVANRAGLAWSGFEVAPASLVK